MSSKASDSGYKSDNSEAKRKRLADAEDSEKKKKKQRQDDSDDDDSRSVTSTASARRKKGKDDDDDKHVKSANSSDSEDSRKKKKSKKDENNKKKKKRGDTEKKNKPKKKKKGRSSRESDSETESDAYSSESDAEYQSNEESSSEVGRSSSEDEDGDSSSDTDSDTKKKKVKKEKMQSRDNDKKKASQDKKSDAKESGKKSKSSAKSTKNDEEKKKKKDKNDRKKKKLSSLEEGNEDASDSDDNEERKESKDGNKRSKASEGDGRAKPSKGRGSRKTAAATLSWNDAVRKLWPDTCQEFLTDESSYEKVSDSAHERPLSIIHVPIQSGIEESLSSRSISEFLLNRSDTAFTNVLSSSHIPALECKISLTKDVPVWTEARTFKRTKKEEQKASDRWSAALEAANADETWTLPQMKKAKSLHIPNIPVGAFGDESVEKATIQLARMVDDVCATSFADTTSSSKKHWDAFADEYNHGILIPGHGTKACTVSIKSGITCTLFNDHVGWSSAAHYMTHKSKGVALWIGVALSDLDDAFERKDIKQMMNDSEIDNVLSAILDIKQKERPSLCHVWQNPGDIVFTPGGNQGYAYIVVTAGPLVELLDFYRTYTTSSIRNCIEFWSAFSSTATIGGLATNRVLPTHKLQYENKMSLGLNDNLARLKSICEYAKPNTLDTFLVVKLSDSEHICEKCDQPASFVYYKTHCEVCLIALSDEDLHEVQTSKESKSSTQGKGAKSSARRGGAAEADTKSRGRKLSGRLDSPQSEAPVGNAVYFTDDELKQARTLLCWQSLFMFLLDPDVVGICRCIPCQKLRKEAQPPKELTSSKCCWDMLRQNRVPLNLVQGTCLCAKCKSADARVGDRSSQLVGNVSASAAAGSSSSSSTRALYEDIPSLEKR
jgi:hypothetical protein